jgi:hypothetical protein
MEPTSFASFGTPIAMQEASVSSVIMKVEEQPAIASTASAVAPSVDYSHAATLHVIDRWGENSSSPSTASQLPASSSLLTSTSALNALPALSPSQAPTSTMLPSSLSVDGHGRCLDENELNWHNDPPSSLECLIQIPQVYCFSYIFS